MTCRESFRLPLMKDGIAAIYICRLRLLLVLGLSKLRWEYCKKRSKNDTKLCSNSQ